LNFILPLHDGGVKPNTWEDESTLQIRDTVPRRQGTVEIEWRPECGLCRGPLVALAGNAHTVCNR